MKKFITMLHNHFYLHFYNKRFICTKLNVYIYMCVCVCVCVCVCNNRCNHYDLKENKNLYKIYSCFY